ncbi:Folliculin [Taenia crassiceps]|uniref:Folliculin n=1 Tax=Taenia crassiceps TaxID=6207 RepID=A0ABR4QEK6_9CEST
MLLIVVKRFLVGRSVTQLVVIAPDGRSGCALPLLRDSRPRHHNVHPTPASNGHTDDAVTQDLCGFHVASASTSHEGTIWPAEQLTHNLFSDLITSTAPPQSTGAVQDTTPRMQASMSCRACSIITRDEIGFVSHDFSAKTDYVSTQFPSDVDLLKAVRTACMRSLSCEVIPGREGPVYFGDDINRHVISYNFFIKDSMARGFQVKYSFLLISWNQVFLLNLWPFVVKIFQTMAKRLQEAANRVYEEETSSGASSTTAASTTATAAAAAAAARSATPPAGTNPLRLCRTPPPSSSLAYHNTSTTPPGRGAPALLSSQAVAAGSALSLSSQANTRKLRGMRITEFEVRSLAELTKDEQVYYRVHAWFTWLLRVAGRNWTPVDLKSAPVDEDEVFAEERKNGLLLGRSGGSGDMVVSGTSRIPSGAINTVDPTTLTLGSELGWTDGTPEVETAVQMRLLSHLYKCIGEEYFLRLVYYLGIGNQVILHPLEKPKVASFTAAALARLLPRGCVRLVNESTTYYPPSQCNLLSLNVGAALSKLGPPETPYVIVQVSLMSPNTAKEEQLATGERPSSPSTSSTDSDTKFDQLNFAISFGQALETPSDNWELAWSRSSSLSENPSSSPWGLPSANPAVPTSTSVTSFPGPVFKKIINSTFARQITEVFRMVDPAQNNLVILQPSTMSLALTAIRQRWIDYARTLYAFQTCCKVSSSVEESTKKYFQFLASTYGLTSDDEAVVLYWQRALSTRTRQDVCHPFPSASTIAKGST